MIKFAYGKCAQIYIILLKCSRKKYTHAMFFLMNIILCW